MNDEQSKRLAEAADAVLQAGEALEEAREALGERRFESDLERERTQAAQQAAARLDAASKRIQEALRKGAIASAALGRPGTYPRYRDALAASRDGRTLGRSVPDQDGIANRRTRGEESLARLQAALDIAASIVFGD